MKPSTFVRQDANQSPLRRKGGAAAGPNFSEKRRKGHGSTESQENKKGGRGAGALHVDEQRFGQNAQFGTSFLDRLHEVANLIATTTHEGHKSLLADPPMPLIPSSKFSLEPDLAHGWKPDRESLHRIPSLSQFRSPSNKRFAQFQEETAKAEREALLAEMMKIPGETNRAAGGDHTEESSDEAQDEASEDDDDEDGNGDGNSHADAEKEKAKEKEKEESEIKEDDGRSNAQLVDQQNNADDEVDQIGEPPANNTNQSLLGQEPEPDPLTPRSNEHNKDLQEEMQAQTKQLIEQAQKLDFEQEDLHTQIKKEPEYKKVKIRRDERNLDGTKVPLLASFYDPWIVHTYMNNTDEYNLIYKRERYKDSQDLLYHNLKLKSDPLLGSGSFNQQTVVLEAASITNGFQFNLGDALQQPQTQESTTAPNQQPCLEFDSEYENGNLEMVYQQKNFAEGQKYVLLIQNDYNSKGHQQWFNFKIKHLKEDTVYQFEIGPFKKSKSKFAEGMLPWLCDLSRRSDKDARFPFYKNIAADHITDVNYTSRRKENGGTMSFLSFRLFIERASTEYSHDRQFLLAYSEPYSYSRLLSLVTELQTSGLAKTAAKWLNFKVGRLCSSLGGTPLPLLKLSQKQNETILSVYHKPIILVTARVHPGESPGSFLCEGLLRAVLNPQNERTVERLLSVAEIHIVPMLNPDGVIIGNSRVNLGGVDMNRRWGANYLKKSISPEIHTLKDYMIRYKNQILMYLDLHGHTQGEGIFFYACQPEIPKPSFKDKQIDLSILEKFLLVQALPTATAKQSPFFNLAKNKYFSIQQDKTGNKMNTARVVALTELGIELSYTIESGFSTYTCSDGKFKGQKFPLDEDAFMRAGADLLSGIFNVTFVSLKLQAMNKTILQFLSQKKNRVTGTAVVKQDAFLENLRPLLKGIFASVKKRFAKIMRLRIQNQLAEAAKKEAQPRPVISSTLTDKMFQTKHENNEKQTTFRKFRATDGIQYGNYKIKNDGAGETSVAAVAEKSERRTTMRKGIDSQSSRTQIPILGLTRQEVSDTGSARSAEDTANNEIFRQTYDNGTKNDEDARKILQKKFTDPHDAAAILNSSTLHYNVQRHAEEMEKDFGNNKHDAKSLSPYRIASQNQTISSLPSFARMEARFTNTQIEPGGKDDDKKGQDDDELTEESDMSGSESEPSVDNMDDFMLEDLQNVIQQQNKKAKKYKKHKLNRKKRKKNFIEQLKEFERNGLDATKASLRHSIERAIAGDARSKSQLAELQTKNHDMTLFALNNQVISNQFIPNNLSLTSNQKNSKKKVQDPRKSSATVLQDATQRNEQAFRLTERMSSVYSKGFLPDPAHLMMDQQARIDAILENRSRNFDAIKNLTTPSLSLNLSQMKETARLSISKQPADREYAVLPVNNFKISNVFGEKNVKASQQMDSILGSVQRNQNASQYILPDISAQTKFNQQELQNLHSSSITAMYKHQAANLTNQPIMNMDQKSTPDIPTTYWKAVPTTLSTFRKKDANTIDQSKSVLSVPLRDLIGGNQKQPDQNYQNQSMNQMNDLNAVKKGFTPSNLKRRINTNEQPLLQGVMQQQKQNRSRFGQRKSTQQPQMQHVIKFNQFNMVPTGMRPNNRGVMLTSNNVGQLNIIQKLAQAEANNKAATEALQNGRSGQATPTNQANFAQQRQKLPHRRVIKIASHVQSQITEASNSAQEANPFTGQTKELAMSSYPPHPDSSRSNVLNASRVQAEHSQVDPYQRSFGSFGNEESMQYAAMLQQTSEASKFSNRQASSRLRPAQISQFSSQSAVKKGMQERQEDLEPVAEPQAQSIAESPLIKRVTLGVVERKSQLTDVTETLVDSRLQELPELAAVTALIRPQF